MGAVVVGPRLIVLTADFRSVSGIDLTTGSKIWTVALPDEPLGKHVIQRLGERVLLRRAGDLIVLDPSTGQSLARHRQPMGDREFVHQVRGMCLLNGSCSAQIIDCEDARPIGELLEGEQMHFHFRHGGGHEASGSNCVGFNVQMFGRAKNLLVYSARALRGPPVTGKAVPMFRGHDELAALDARTGKARWKRAKGCGRCSEATSGVTPDGRTGWLMRDTELEVFDAATGRVRFKRKLLNPVLHALWVAGSWPGLFVASEAEVVMFTPVGRERFRRRQDDQEVLPLAVGSLITPLAHLQLRSRAKYLSWIGPQSGSETSRVEIGDQVLLPAADGQAALFGQGEDRDAGGQVIEGARGLRLDVRRGRKAGSDGPPNVATVIERSTDTELLTINSDAWTLGEWSSDEDGPRFVALFVHDGDDVSAVRVLRLDAQ
jgi:PQQ-like domain